MLDPLTMTVAVAATVVAGSTTAMKVKKDREEICRYYCGSKENRVCEFKYDYSKCPNHGGKIGIKMLK